jgi:FkbM family methyltransferase
MIRLAMLLSRLRTELVVDVGANEGQFARELRAAGYRGRILSVEPLPAAHAKLAAAARTDARWYVADRCAVGAASGRATLNVASNSVSSSLRAMTSAHLEAASESRYIATEEVDVVTLDSLLDRYGQVADSAVFVKLDVQGHEGEVLSGAGSRLDTIGGVQLELSLVELYSGQGLMPDQIDFLAEHGLSLWSIDRGFMDGASGRLLQCDGTFVRESALSRP